MSAKQPAPVFAGDEVYRHHSAAIRAIARLPFGRRLALRVYNRLLMHLWPRHRVRTWFGAELDCDARDMIQATLTHFRAWEPNTSRAFAQVLKPGDIAVDVGANIGYFTLLFSRLVGPSGGVVAIEALPKLARVVAENAQRNSGSNVRVANVAVAASAGRMTVYEAPGTNIGMTTTRADRGFPESATVEALPLETILTEDELRRVRLVKVDIEGAEIPVMRHLLDTLDLYPAGLAVAVEANPAENPEWPELFECFLAAGFKAYDLCNDYDWLALMEGRTVEPKPLEALPPLQTDLLFTRSAS